MKQKLFWIGIATILLSYIGNYLYFYSKQLEEPIFLKHYYYRQYYPDFEIEFPIYYITNKSNPLSISHVEIDGVDASVGSHYGHYYWMKNSDIYYLSEFTHHYLMSASIKIRTYAHSLQLEENETWSFNEMKVYFSNGESMTVDIGEVTISNQQYDYNKPESALRMYSSSASNNLVEYYGEVKKSLTIDKIDSPYWDFVKNNVKININSPDKTVAKIYYSKDEKQKWENIRGKEITDHFSPIKFNAQEKFHLIMQFNNSTSIFEIPIKISGTTEDGEPFEFSTWIHSGININQDLIDKIIQSINAGETNE